ncbi:transcription elongation factor GreA [Candidatus Uhrbacteria bacterium]|nr:transcription elongation factor GreA [Candidatus Uhrbacteria bacterium]
MDHKSVTHISAEGLQMLKDELAHRMKVLRPLIAQKIGDAKELGDISENFEYHDAKEQQGQNEMRIVTLQHMIATAQIVESKAGGTIGLGSKFTVKTGATERNFELVGENEANPMEGKISNVSPLGAAFVGKGVGDKVEVTVPSGTMTYEVVAIA